MDTFELKVETPDGESFQGEAVKLFCRTIEGDICILARHIDYCSALGMGEARITLPDGTVRAAACIGGMVSMMSNVCRLMATTWEWKEDIDVQRAAASKARAESALAQSQLDKQELTLAEARLHRALVRLSVGGNS